MTPEYAAWLEHVYTALPKPCPSAKYAPLAYKEAELSEHYRRDPRHAIEVGWEHARAITAKEITWRFWGEWVRGIAACLSARPK